MSHAQGFLRRIKIKQHSYEIYLPPRCPPAPPRMFGLNSIPFAAPLRGKVGYFGMVAKSGTKDNFEDKS